MFYNCDTNPNTEMTRMFDECRFEIKALRDTRSRSFHLCEARHRLELVGKYAWADIKDVMDWYHVPGDQAAVCLGLHPACN